ncbi:shikimate kinase [Dyadobacter fanqingshengii]|uniref:Shikimate kinase n=1 Tax=Dyadobacter fanqingshengii TaxID=2906443 RepID=A0A9X1TAT1_9BACT|nr:shikimate kinase [Dyadobacter fanqingshengii]MCF0041808.1 shikimate kinase [Dyadobacter fanqingshengii]USJ36481.1 shikimate kinase [Dyadobacter fanqingshengii]
MKNVILVGMMSSGKSTLGKKLARLLNYKFVDLDKLIEKDQQSDIPTLFAQKGEHYFREVESRLLKEQGLQQGIVLASGGGTPCFHDNMSFIKEMGISVFLDVPAANLAKRIRSHGKDDRPILSGAASLEETLQSKISERLPFYNQADIVIKGEVEASHLLEILHPLL